MRTAKEENSKNNWVTGAGVRNLDILVVLLCAQIRRSFWNSDMFISNSVRTHALAGLTYSHGPTELVWPVQINGGSIPNLISNQLIKCLVCLCYVKKIIALSVMRNADRSSFVSEQVLLTEKPKEKISVLRNWHWCCTGKRMIKFSTD